MPRTRALLDVIHREEGPRILGRASQLLPPTLRAEQVLGEGVPAEEIADRARRSRADFIVMGTRNRGRPSHFLLGSTAEAVIRKAHGPAVTVGDEAATVQQPGIAAVAAPAALYEVLPAT